MSFDDGTVHLSLKTYNDMRDELDQRRKATLTHQEFLKKFRLSLLSVIEKCKLEGLDFSELYGYYKDIDFVEVEKIEIIKGEENWIVKLKTKEDGERSSITTD